MLRFRNKAIINENRNIREPGSLENGWTYIEIIIVVTIILILTSAVGISGIRYVDQARVSSAVNEMAALSVALDGYYLDTGSYPSAEQGLSALWEQPSIAPVPDSWTGPYISKNDFNDPWDNPYIYNVPGTNDLPFEIVTFAADGQEGGEGKNADIRSWEQ